MACVIVLGGDAGCFGYTKSEDDFVIACDSGYDRALSLNISVDLIIGDMDSLVSKVEVSKIFHPSRKDDTDCMLAIKEGINRGYKNFVLLSGFGGNRTDQLYANFQSMAYISSQGFSVSMHGANEWCMLIKDSLVHIDRSDTHSLSVFSVSDISEGVTIKGASYPLNNATISSSFPIGVSNFILEEQAEVSVKSGMLMIMLSPMEERH